MSAEAPTTISEAILSRNTCPKCGTIKKSGRQSCCARGGAWFKKCGDVGDTIFDHTWTEGIQACTSSEMRQIMLPREENVTYSLNISFTTMHNSTQQHTFVHRPDAASDTETKDAADYLSVVKTFVCVIIIPIIWRSSE